MSKELLRYFTVHVCVCCGEINDVARTGGAIRDKLEHLNLVDVEPHRLPSTHGEHL